MSIFMLLQGDMLKPLKINDEITIIPQPARAKTKPAGPNRNPQKKVLQIFSNIL